ncbi:hypothetical protein LOTGIDRAFT_159821 [Lottia gigantea]|uniref:C-type lectin domain-containing protein n=1 Tax=Lottia gigantea TaxID=225164 RepID=V4AHL9_LOTGI|nr:hypothetical protein LOTGIDRAFT_159821 [Lottia gigantea]ESO96412.1 hypothetical protein LOTGIDRAFT_159821 [Lottia gigantea]
MEDNTRAPTVNSVDCGPLWERSRETGSCYQYPEVLLNWFEAKQFCTEQGSVLASINNPQEQLYLTGRVLTLPNVYLWLGLNDLNHEGGWEWIDRTPLAYINWSDGQPDNNGNGEDCGAILTSTGKWSDFPCQNKTAFICKKRGEKTPATTPLPVSRSSTLPEGLIFGCGEEWTAYQDSCYQVLDQEYPWMVARDVCKTLTASLISIEDQLENDFIRGLMAMYNDSAWIGLNDIEKESVFKWVDNRSVSFTNWGNNQPNNLNGHENCVYINPQGGWMDYNCFIILSYSICEKPIPGTTSKVGFPTGHVVTSATKIQWTTRTSSVITRNSIQAVTTPAISYILNPSPTTEADGLTYRGIVGVSALVIVLSLVIFAFILYSCRMVQQGHQREYRAGFENPLYHGDFNEDKQFRVFTLSNDKRVSVSISEENQNGAETQTNTISVTVERITEVKPEVTSHSDTSNADVSNPYVTSTEIVQYDIPKTVNQKSKEILDAPNTTNTPEVSEIRSGQILGINQEILDSYKSD